MDPARRAAIIQREEELGMPIDPLTGYPVKIDRLDAPVARIPGMVFWERLDQELIGARNENGFVVPSELYLALDRWGIRDEDNRETAKLMIDSIAAGRNKAATESIKKPSPKEPASGKRNNKL